MNERHMSDIERLEQAVAIFRTRAGLHDNSPPSSLIAYAHEAGKEKPYADMVRDAWHWFETGRRYAELEVVRYRISYSDPEPPPPPKDDDAPPAPTEEERRHMRGVMMDDEEYRGGRATGADLDQFKDPETGEWVSQEELHRRQTRRAAKPVDTIKPEALNDTTGGGKEVRPAAPEPQSDLENPRSGAATATEPLDDEEVLF